MHVHVRVRVCVRVCVRVRVRVLVCVRLRVRVRVRVCWQRLRESSLDSRYVRAQLSAPTLLLPILSLAWCLDSQPPRKGADAFVPFALPSPSE